MSRKKFIFNQDEQLPVNPRLQQAKNHSLQAENPRRLPKALIFASSNSYKLSLIIYWNFTKSLGSDSVKLK